MEQLSHGAMTHAFVAALTAKEAKGSDGFKCHTATM